MDTPIEAPIPTETVPTPELVVTKQNSLWLPVILSLLFAVTLIAGTFFYLQTKSLKQQLTALASPTATPTPSPITATDPTADWETYTNQDLGFELKYPPTVQIDKEMNDEYNKATIFRGGELYFEVMIRTGREASDIDLAQYYYMDNPDFTKSTLGGRVANVYVYDASKSSCVSDGTGPGCPLSYVVYAAAIGKSLYHVSFYGDATLSATEEQILKTFRFTGTAKETTNLNEWQTYKGMDFSFKYPNTWNVGNNPIYLVSDVSGAGITIFSKDSVMYNECMRLDDTKTSNGLMIKYYSYASSGEMCTNSANVGNKQVWITKEGGDGFQPGIIYDYDTSIYPKSFDIITAIIGTFRFTSE